MGQSALRNLDSPLIDGWWSCLVKFFRDDSLILRSWCSCKYSCLVIHRYNLLTQSATKKLNKTKLINQRNNYSEKLRIEKISYSIPLSGQSRLKVPYRLKGYTRYGVPWCRAPYKDWPTVHCVIGSLVLVWWGFMQLIESKKKIYFFPPALNLYHCDYVQLKGFSVFCCAFLRFDWLFGTLWLKIFS